MTGYELARRNMMCAVCCQTHKVQNEVCVACRHFFRRAVINKTVFKECQNRNKCYTGTEVSLRCKICRYQKCFELKAFFTSKTSIKKHISKDQTNIPSHPLPEFTSSIEVMINELKVLEISIRKCQKSTFNPWKYPCLEQFIEESSKLSEASRKPVIQRTGLFNSVLQPMPSWPLKLNEFLQKQTYLKYLKARIKDGYASSIDWTTINTKEWLPFNLYMAAENIKALPFFDKLCDMDKKSLLRGVCFVAATCTSVCSAHENGKDMIHTPDGIGISETNNIHVVTSILSIEESHFIKTNNGSKTLLIPPIKEKFTIKECLLLKAIAICNPNLDLTNHGRNLINQERMKYARILFNYCLRKYRSNYAPSRYVTLLDYIGVLQRHRQYFYDFMKLSKLFSTVGSSTYDEQFVSEIMEF